MTNNDKDLVEALRLQGWNEAADRIEQLERDNHRWKMECKEFWRAREAKAVEALRVSLEGLNWAKAYLSTGGIDSVTVNHADATVYAVLAELTSEGNP